MNKSNEIIQITSSVLERYRSSIPRKAFAEAMERVIELVLGPGECPATSDCPGLVMLRSPNMEVEHMAQLICGAVRRSRLSLAISHVTSTIVNRAGKPG